MLAIYTFDQIEPGDAIVFQSWENDHEGIVTSVKVDSTDRRKGSVSVIHYEYSSWFTKKTIKEENIQYDLSCDHIYRKTYDNIRTFDATTVINRARARIGETRYDSLYNTSRHLVEWAKVGNTSMMLEMGSYPTTGGLVRRYNAYSWHDIERGSIIGYTYYGLEHAAVVTNVDAQTNTATIIHYGTRHLLATRTIMRENLVIDFARNTVRTFHCDDKFSQNYADLVVEKAKKRVGEQKWDILFNTSWIFCLNCLFD